MVILQYGGHQVRTLADLGAAIGATAKKVAELAGETGDRPVEAEVWREGETLRFSLATGSMAWESGYPVCRSGSGTKLRWASTEQS